VSARGSALSKAAERARKQHAIVYETEYLDHIVGSDRKYQIVARFAHSTDIQRHAIAAMRDMIDADLSIADAPPMHIRLAWFFRDVSHRRQDDRGVSIPGNRAETALAPFQSVRAASRLQPKGDSRTCVSP
jgi:hypothetical protein